MYDMMSVFVILKGKVTRVRRLSRDKARIVCEDVNELIKTVHVQKKTKKRLSPSLLGENGEKQSS